MIIVCVVFFIANDLLAIDLLNTYLEKYYFVLRYLVNLKEVCLVCCETHSLCLQRPFIALLASVLKGRMSRLISTRCQKVLAPLSV